MLVIEDERNMAYNLKTDLTRDGFDVEVVYDGEAAVEQLEKHSFDVAVLDIMLPKLDGIEVLKRVRTANNNIPIVLLSARSRYEDRVTGLAAGADDYLTKPFGIEELIFRIRNITRRHHAETHQEIRVADLVIDLMEREVRRNGERIYLRPTEFKLLATLAQSPGRIFTKYQLHKKVWDYDFDPQSNMLRVTFTRLRQHIDHGREEPLIETIRGSGYRLRKVG